MSTDYDPNYKKVKDFFLVGLKCIIFNEDGKALIVRRSDKVRGGGYWSLIGGGLDSGEDPYEGLKREAREEAQIEIFDIKPIHTLVTKDGEDDILLTIFQAKTKDEVTLNWEHDEYKWVSAEEVSSLDISERLKSYLKSANI